MSRSHPVASKQGRTGFTACASKFAPQRCTLIMLAGWETLRVQPTLRSRQGQPSWTTPPYSTHLRPQLH